MPATTSDSSRSFERQHALRDMPHVKSQLICHQGLKIGLLCVVILHENSTPDGKRVGRVVDMTCR